METVKIKVYSIDELSQEAKTKALSYYREHFSDDSYLYDEAHNTVKAFHNVFPTMESHNSRFRYLSDWGQNVDELKGLRLRKWLINNYFFNLYSGKYYGRLSPNDKYGEPIPVSREHPIGQRHVKRHSKVIFDTLCVLTGVCYDDSLLAPIYEFIEHAPHNRERFSYMGLSELFDACFNSLEADLNAEIEARQDDGFVAREIEANEYRFTKDGRIFDL